MPLYLIVNTISIILTIVGFFGVLKLEKWYIIGHALLTTAILGTCFLFSILEALLRREDEEKVFNFLLFIIKIVLF